MFFLHAQNCYGLIKITSLDTHLLKVPDIMNFMVNPELRDEALEWTIRRFGHHLNGTFRFFRNQDGMDIKIMFRKDVPSVISSTLKEDNFQKTTLFGPDVHKFLLNKIPAGYHLPLSCIKMLVKMMRDQYSKPPTGILVKHGIHETHTSEML